MELVRGDVRDVKSLEPFFFDGAGYDEVVCIHTAGIVSIASKFLQSVIDVNVKGTKILWRCAFARCETVGVHQFRARDSGTAGGRGDPRGGPFEAADVVGLYAKSKARATQIVLDSVQRGLTPSLCIRPGSLAPMTTARGT